MKVKNWSQFQHYKDRSPPWLKLHRSLLDNLDYHMLSPMAAKCLPLIWLIASESDGVIPETVVLAFRLRLPESECFDVVEELEGRSFLVAEDAEQAATTSQQKENKWGSRHIPAKIRIEVWNRDGGKCAHCSSTENVEYDHVTPISKGGESTACNLQLLCRPCNRRKRVSVATPTLGRRSPEREVETEREREVEKARAPRSPNGSRLPPDWQPSETDIDFAASKRPDVDWRGEAEKFRDYWHGVAGAKGRKADWTGTWRNWIRRAEPSKASALIRADTKPVKEALAPTESKEERDAAWRRQMQNLGVTV
jgi:5-methylcytosine-specific restriction endonuclease McrA